MAGSTRLGPAGDGPQGRRRAPLSRGDPDRPNEVRNGGVDEARTRDLRRDRQKSVPRKCLVLQQIYG